MENLSPEYINRFGGVARLYGQRLFQSLSTTHVTVVGIGGVGSWCAEALIRTGIGEITLIDMDEICVTNTNRQLHTLHDSVGKSKVETMKERLLKINPEAKIHAIVDFVTEETLEKLITSDMHIVVDAIDSLKNKALMANFCREKDLKLITIGGAGGKSDPTQLRIGDLADSAQDNLLRRLKKKLRRDFNFPSKGAMGIRAVYSFERAVYPGVDGEICYKDELKDKSMAALDCATGMGTVSFATGAFGFAAAKEVMELLKESLGQ